MTISFTVKAEDLAPQLKWISSGVSKNAESRARMEISPEGKLTLKMDNKINNYEGQLDIKFNEGGAPNRKRVLFADGSNLVKAQRLLSTGDVSLTTNDNETELMLSTPKANYVIGLYADGKVSSKETIATPLGTVMSTDFNKALKQVSRASVSLDMPVLECVYVEFFPAEKIIKFTATDRFVLAHKVIKYEPNAESTEDVALVINARTLAQSANSIDNQAVLNLFIENNGHRFGVSSNDKIAKIGTNNEEYVRYAALLEGEVDKEVIFNKKDLISTLTDVRDLGNAPTVYLDITKNSAKFTSGNIKMNLDAQFSSDDPYDLKFSVDKLVSAIGILTTDTIKLQFSPNKRRGVLMKEVSKDSTEKTDFTGVVIPSIKG